MAKIISGRVKKTPQSGITSDRYEFLGLDQAEPDLGDPLVGPSSTGANPHPPGDQYILVNVGGNTGKRYWMRSFNLIPPNTTPGTFTVYNNNAIVGAANSFNVFNFVGAGVTVDFVGPNPQDQTGVATVRIQVTELIAPGNDYELPYHDPVTGFLRGATDIVFRSGNIGIGSTLPAEKLDVLGNANISGQIGVNTAVVGFISATDSDFNTSTIGIATITSDLNVGQSSTVIKTLNGNVGIGSVVPQYKLDVFGSSKFHGPIHDYLGNPGTVGEVLFSNGVNTPPSWGVVDNISAGSASSVSTQEASNNQLYYIGFSSTTDNFSKLYVDSDALYYNPSNVRLGIGTQPQYSLDVNGTIHANQVIAQNITVEVGVVTTASVSGAPVVVDTFNASQYRSAKYNVQVTTNNQLKLGTASVSNIVGGSGYTAGVYNDIALISSGIGTGAKASLVVSAPNGDVTGVLITNSGSGYEVGEILTINDADLSGGSGFNFTVAGPLIESFQVSDLMVMHSVGAAVTEVSIVEYAGIANLENLGDYSADINAGIVSLKFTPLYAHNTFKLFKDLIDV